MVIHKVTSKAVLCEPRPLCVIASDIARCWQQEKLAHGVTYAAKPYLNAMFGCASINDVFGYDQASSIVRYFLSNATSWRGDNARRLKAELKALLPK